LDVVKMVLASGAVAKNIVWVVTGPSASMLARI
jgi:hypothetical protein